MRNTAAGPQEAENQKKANKSENERAALMAVIDYTLQCARDRDGLGCGEAVEKARLYLSNSVLA
ncbi:hypothetical protein [Cribrihabitans neustonicus]|uniref:hypothetical protein n=1 Tax=Cribrihabitans neustonicus TaxID=1429085 RepID=UPI003B5C1C15